MSEQTSTQHSDPGEQDALWSRLRVIESQPLPERAAAYAAMHEELSRHLDSGPDSPGGE